VCIRVRHKRIIDCDWREYKVKRERECFDCVFDADGKC